jgi:uncharacterized protein
VWIPHFSSNVLQTASLLIVSNFVMTYAWYGHLRTLSDKPWNVAVLVSWGIALFEYVIMVQEHRLGFGTMSLMQLKLLQEIISMIVVVPFAIITMKQPIKNEFLCAALCLVGAMYVVFRSR